jgi:hypothetical protein
VAQFTEFFDALAKVKARDGTVSLLEPCGLFG